MRQVAIVFLTTFLLFAGEDIKVELSGNEKLILEEQIKRFTMLDETSALPDDAILFLGGEAISDWRFLSRDIKHFTPLNRAFGKKLSHVYVYGKDVIVKYRPLAVFFAPHEGEIASPRLMPEEYIKMTEAFFKRINDALPETKIFIISVKPSPKRHGAWLKIVRVNRWLSDLAARFDYIEYIDLSTMLLDSDKEGEGIPLEKYFEKDGLSLNRDGYALWAEVINKKLEEFKYE